MDEHLRTIARSTSRPLPQPNPFSQPFWDAARRHELLLQKCDDCATVRYYPRPRCPECLSDRATWTPMSGRGTVYSFSIVYRPLARWFTDRIPLAVAIVELAEGVRMMANVVDVDPEQVHVGMDVTVSWDDVNDEITLPQFTPALP